MEPGYLACISERYRKRSEVAIEKFVESDQIGGRVFLNRSEKVVKYKQDKH